MKNIITNKYPIIEKAWILDNSNLYEPWFHNCDIVYYGTRGQAKQNAIPDNDAGKMYDGSEITFLNIKVKRYKEEDKILVNGSVIKRNKLKIIERSTKIKNLDKDKFYYVQDARSYVGNAVLWHGNGYVTDLSKAEKFSYDDIQKMYLRETDIVWESLYVENKIKQYVDSQYLDRDYSL